MATTHFTVTKARLDGSILEFEAQLRDGAPNGAIVETQTYRTMLPATATQAAQELAMAAAVRADAARVDLKPIAVLVPNGTTLAIAAPALSQIEIDTADFLKKYARIVALKKAVDAGLLLANDSQVTTRIAAAQAAFALHPAQYLDLL